MITDLANGLFGKVYTMDVTNGGVRLLDLPEGTDQAVVDAIATAQQAIIDGSIEVSAIGDADGMDAKLAELGYNQ
jgi:septum formation inhibitor-activating ATPase MinD